MNFQNNQYGLGTIASTGTAGYAAPDVSPIQQPRFEGIAESYANVPNDLYKAVMRLRSLADRYGGSVPEAVSKEAQVNEPSSLVARMEANANAVHSLLGQLHAQIDRLERF